MGQHEGDFWPSPDFHLRAVHQNPQGTFGTEYPVPLPLSSACSFPAYPALLPLHVLLFLPWSLTLENSTSVQGLQNARYNLDDKTVLIPMALSEASPWVWSSRYGPWQYSGAWSLVVSQVCPQVVPRVWFVVIQKHIPLWSSRCGP